MSQARTIYGYISQTENKAADQALLLGLRRVEEPYRTALLEVMLDRGTTAVTCELIGQYHQFSTAWQGIMRRRVDALYGGLYLAGRTEEIQTRLNCLSIIKHTHYLKLADLVVNMLWAREKQVNREAGATLLELVRSYNSEAAGEVAAGDETEISGEELGDFTRRDGKIPKRQILLSALKKAIDNYPVHQRSEAVLAGMYLVPAERESFWGKNLVAYHPVGKAVRYILLNNDGSEVARFCLSALRHPDLCSTAVRAIAEQKRPGFIAALARQFRLDGDELVLRGLKMVKQPGWLDEKQFGRGRFSPEEQLDLLELAVQVGAAVEEKVSYLCAAAREGAEAAGLKAVALLGGMAGQEGLKGLVRLMSCGRELVVLAAAMQLIKKEVPQLNRLLIEKLDSSFEQVRGLARGYYRNIAFKRYWENFDHLAREQRIAGGRAVYKIDREAHARWVQRAQDKSAEQRLRAVRIARLLGRQKVCFEELTRLARDPNRKVRSCAVAGLGEMKVADSSTRHLLISALEDEDNRVRANAVEALEQYEQSEAVARIARLTNDDNNRVRANAIKALLSMKVASARGAVQEMLQDRRAPHRRSARWVVRTLLQDAGGVEQSSLAPGEAASRQESSYADTGVVMV